MVCLDCDKGKGLGMLKEGEGMEGEGQNKRPKKGKGRAAKVEGPENPVDSAAGIAAVILKELSSLLPGLDRLIEGLEKSPTFRERLEAIDREIEARLRSQPLVRAEGQDKPSAPSRLSGRNVAKGSTPVPQQGRPRVKEAPIAPVEPPADVFDEGTYLRVLVELPGVKDKDIQVSLNQAQLMVSANTLTRQYHKEITLPCAPQGPMERLYRNGILKLTLAKA